ncbi:serine hydrolase domain-containing protein [uncultured Sunxiuqinia sp.]|uniref:serine hydrolase domain-containing protein n=1 Tax=uncultured Sunxiuqinia sp. TaxID=1573825 RepID=UPI002636F9F9|nr:serine hydrolase domain-containing protein [uncultured Sunxiuqinia sp.]
MLKLITFLFSILVLFSCTQPAQIDLDTKVINPKEAGFSEERLALADSLIERYKSNQWLPGGVFLVARRGTIAYYKSFGYHSLNFWTPYQNDDIFRIASMTKAVTSVAVMQLYEQGKLGLDDPLKNYLPAFAETGVLQQLNPADSSFTTTPPQRPITIRHLLTHTSGLVYGDFEQGDIRAAYQKLGLQNVGLSHQSWTTKQFIDQLARAPLAFHPGERYCYGLNMDVLGRVIEVVSGLSLRDYFQQHIFEPLEMVDTHFYLPQEKHERLVPVYAQTDQGTIMKQEVGHSLGINYPKNKDRGHYAGGGGLSSTALDYARFMQALLNGGELNGQRILGPKTVEVMTSDQLLDLNKKGAGRSSIPGKTFSLGFGLLTEEAEGLNSKSPGTYEWGGYFNTQFFIDPKEELIFVGMTQVHPFNHSEFYDRLTAVIYGAIDD